jgi:hypothetical protein
MTDNEIKVSQIALGIDPDFGLSSSIADAVEADNDVVLLFVMVPDAVDTGRPARLFVSVEGECDPAEGWDDWYYEELCDEYGEPTAAWTVLALRADEAWWPESEETIPGHDWRNVVGQEFDAILWGDGVLRLYFADDGIDCDARVGIPAGR